MIRAFQELLGLHKVFDAAAGLLETSLGAPACIPGCGRCCQENTPFCNLIEGINMVSALPAYGNLKAAVEEAEGWLLEPHGLRIYRGVPSGVMSPELKDEMRRANKTQCPFLSLTMECRIHKVRPLTCRAFGVFRDAIPICPRPLGKGETEARRAIISSDTVAPLVENFRKNCQSRQPAWAIMGFVPTMLFRAAEPRKLQAYIEDNRIASAKLVGLGISMNIELMWQPQLDQLRAGVSPGLVLASK